MKLRATLAGFGGCVFGVLGAEVVNGELSSCLPRWVRLGDDLAEFVVDVRRDRRVCRRGGVCG